MRPKPRAERTADEWRQHADLVLGEAKHVAHIAVGVLRALRLVVYGQASVALPNCRAAEALHGIMVLHRGAIFLLDARPGSRQGLVDFAAGRDRRHPSHSRHFRFVGLVDFRDDISDRLCGLIFDGNQSRGVTCDLELLRHHQRDGLAGKEDLIVVERPEGGAGRGSLVGIFLGRRCDFRPIVVRKHLDHARHGECRAPIDTLDATLRDLTRDHHAISEIGHV